MSAIVVGHLSGRWWCQSCESLFVKRHTLGPDGNGYHSWHCPTPLVRVDVTFTQPDADA